MIKSVKCVFHHIWSTLNKALHSVSLLMEILFFFYLDRFLISVLICSILPLYAVKLVLICAVYLQLKSWIINIRQRVITPLFLTHPLNAHKLVYCTECLSMCFSNLCSNQRPWQQQCYYCQQSRRGLIGAHCVWDIHYSWIWNYFHTFGWLWSQEM